MNGGRRIISCTCGTRESFAKHANEARFQGMAKVIPAEVYISEGSTGMSLHIIISQEWEDWLMGKTDEMPKDETYSNFQTVQIREKVESYGYLQNTK